MDGPNQSTGASSQSTRESNQSREGFDKEETASILKACIVSQKGGIPQEELDDAFFKCTGYYIPYLALGYPSLYQYMRMFTDIVKERNEDKVLVYKVFTPEMAHIANMVERQKDSVPNARYTKTNKNRTRVINSKVGSNNNGKNDRPNGNWKRKATNDGRRGRRTEKRRKDDEKTRLRNWNQFYDRNSSSEEGNHASDCPWDISNSEDWYADEYNHQVKIMDKPAKMDVICEPIVGGKQLIGDDFFLQLAIRNAGMPVWRKGPCTALHSGLCISGQTIKDCTRTLKKVQSLSNRLVIMLGAEDIYRDHSSDKMIEDMEDLLEYLEARYSFSRSAITLCTIPPLANLSMNCDRQKLANLQRFNSWIREQTNLRYNSDQWDSTLRYNLIEFYNQNTIVQISTNYEYFQLDARMVSGSPHPYVLWNVRGRRLAMNLLRTCH